ncbi:unnamed protein product [Boreogadus saida]
MVKRAAYFNEMELQVLLESYDEEKDIITRKGNAKASAIRRTKAWQRIADRSVDYGVARSDRGEDKQRYHIDLLRQQGAARSADAADGSGRSAAGGSGAVSAVVGYGVESAAGESAAGETAAGRSAAGESGAGSAAVSAAGEFGAGSAAGGSSAGAAGAEAGADPGAVNVAAGATGSVPPLPYFEDVDLDSEEQSEPKKQQAPSAAENLSSSQSGGTEAASTSCTGRDPTVITNEGKEP